jgi:CubicO group peptidase (beta-lactamase class C family)
VAVVGVSAGFEAAHAVLQAEVDAGRLAGVSCATLRHGELIDSFSTGLADREAGLPIRPDTIHRAFSNTKLFTTVLVLMLAERGHWQLDDAVKRWIPASAHCGCCGAAPPRWTTPSRCSPTSPSAS